MEKKLFKIILFFTITLLIDCNSKETHSEADQIVNFNHLANLTETIILNSEQCDIVHIYSEYPDYQWVDAAEEGIACVDDVARAAVVYLRYYEITGIDSILVKAKRLLNFVLYMQAEDGEFYNFIDSNYQINKTYRTSKKSFDFWAARGYWAIGLGYRIFKEKDRDYAAKLKDAFLKCKIPIKKNLDFYKKYVEIKGRKYPLWLVNQYGSDATATLLVGINEFLKAEHDQQLERYAVQLAEGMMDMQLEDGCFFRGAFLSWQELWHAWGNAQTQAMASLGKTLNQVDFIQAAKQEADDFYPELFIQGMQKEWELGNNNADQFPQISYGIRCMSLGLLRLYETTGNEDYAKLAGLAASWLMGNNAAKTQMYDPNTGRCFDGIVDSTNVNYNAGAESTIEALLTVLDIANHSIARRYLNSQTVKQGIIQQNEHQISSNFRIFNREDGSQFGLVNNLSEAGFQFIDGEELKDLMKQNP
jgi:hypothetical protein